MFVVMNSPVPFAHLSLLNSREPLLKYCELWICKSTEAWRKYRWTCLCFNICMKSGQVVKVSCEDGLSQAASGSGPRLLGDPLRVFRAALHSQLLQSEGPVRRFSSPCLPPVRLQLPLSARRVDEAQREPPGAHREPHRVLLFLFGSHICSSPPETYRQT